MDYQSRLVLSPATLFQCQHRVMGVDVMLNTIGEQTTPITTTNYKQTMKERKIRTGRSAFRGRNKRIRVVKQTEWGFFWLCVLAVP